MVKQSLSELRTRNIELTRKLLKESVTPDLLLVQAVQTVNELDEILNRMIVNLRERYGYYFPKTAREADNNTLLGAAESMPKDDLGINPDAAALASLKELVSGIKSVSSLKESQEKYLESLASEVCPNLAKEAGFLLASRIIALAGSLKHLAEIPSSTVQVLGAEKALFRHLKSGAKPPRFGIIFVHESISSAKEAEKGKTARRLASRISLAAKMDYFRKK